LKFKYLKREAGERFLLMLHWIKWLRILVYSVLRLALLLNAM
jgi:hypothetical protein